MKGTLLFTSAITLGVSIFSPLSFAHEKDTLDDLVIFGHQLNGENISASEGTIGQGEIQSRPIQRTGDVLELVPGMAVTQHSGSGKANQYYLRGFNLDHGTDFSTFVDGMPINMRSHGHGQGYTDLNFLVPEWIARMDYQKGPYYAENGDFSSAGSAKFHLPNALPNGQAKLEIGSHQFQRITAMDDFAFGKNNLILGAEVQSYQGPWKDINEDVRKRNALLRYHGHHLGGQTSVTLMAYQNQWNSADQIPQRAVDQNRIDRFGSIDKNLGGESSRYSLSTNWENDQWQLSAYAIRSKLNLFSNFTYQLDNPTKGDQFEQVDDRWIYGGQIQSEWEDNLGKIPWLQKSGVQFRYDDIGEVGLHQTQNRQRFHTVRQDKIQESSIGFYYQSDFDLSEQLSLTLGARYDLFHVKVNSHLAANSGKQTQGLPSLKGALNYAFTPQWEGFINAGQGFHSNDARGVTITQDPSSGQAADSVDLLVRTFGAETGLRFYQTNAFNASFALWWLELDSELVFVGDAGNTETSDASQRYGAELVAYTWLTSNWNLDFEASWSEVRYRNQAEGGNHIEGALPFVLSTGLSHTPELGWQAALRVRHLAANPLTRDNQQRSQASTLTNGQIGYRWKRWQLNAQVFNLFDEQANDIEYYYRSRLNGEASGGIEDIHFHPVEPRAIRASVTYEF